MTEYKPHTSPSKLTKNQTEITWQRWPEAVKLLLSGATIPTALPVALVVGSILSVINQSNVILKGLATPLTWMQIGMNFIVPFCVSSYSFLMACRTTKGDRFRISQYLKIRRAGVQKCDVKNSTSSKNTGSAADCCGSL